MLSGAEGCASSSQWAGLPGLMDRAFRPGGGASRPGGGASREATGLVPTENELPVTGGTQEDGEEAIP